MTMGGDSMLDEVQPAIRGARPLARVRVVDLTSVVMGPFGTHILADLGADVIKVEPPGGDSFRSYRPVRHAGMSGGFLHLNRNKRSLLLDLKRPEACAALNKVIAGADVFVHSMRPDAIARLGYDYEAVSKLSPDIIYCSAHGFGAAGRYAGKAAYDDIIQAGSGLSALQAVMHGAPGYLPTVLCDKVAGQAIAYSVMAGLFQRAKGGGGQAIEVPMFETLVEFNLVEHMMGLPSTLPSGRRCSTGSSGASRTPRRTASPAFSPIRTATGTIFLTLPAAPSLRTIHASQAWA
jgi:crotonobetainyl-CoA:carnitine CoA-transferase CaiB-like acyl-CoA transferase